MNSFDEVWKEKLLKKIMNSKIIIVIANSSYGCGD